MESWVPNYDHVGIQDSNSNHFKNIVNFLLNPECLHVKTPTSMNPGFKQQFFKNIVNFLLNPGFISGNFKHKNMMMTRFKQQIFPPLNGETVVRFHARVLRRAHVA
jgi:hypothetical protein